MAFLWIQFVKASKGDRERGYEMKNPDKKYFIEYYVATAIAIVLWYCNYSYCVLENKNELFLLTMIRWKIPNRLNTTW